MKSPAKTAFETILIIGVLFALAVAPRLAGANPGQKHTPPPFAEFDTDGNGYVSEDEFNTTRAKHMAAMVEAGMPMKGAASAPAFSDLDTDKDMQLSEEELIAGKKAHMQSMRGHGRGAGCGKHKGKKMAGGKGRKMTTFEDIDTDADGSISREEFAAHQASHHGRKH